MASKYVVALEQQIPQGRRKPIVLTLSSLLKDVIKTVIDKSIGYEHELVTKVIY